MNYGGDREGKQAFTPLGQVRYFLSVVKTLGMVCRGYAEVQNSYISSEVLSLRRY